MKKPAKQPGDSDADPLLKLELHDSDASRKHQLSAALNQLDERSLDIINRRWLSEEKSKLSELAHEYGISIERVRQVELGAMKKVRKYLERDQRC